MKQLAKVTLLTRQTQVYLLRQHSAPGPGAGGGGLVGAADRQAGYCRWRSPTENRIALSSRVDISDDFNVHVLHS